MLFTHDTSLGATLLDRRCLVHTLVTALLYIQGGRTPLHLAALQGHMQLVKLLENSGANVNASDEHGMTPLHKAAVQGHADTVAELLAHGAHIDAKLTVSASCADLSDVL